MLFFLVFPLQASFSRRVKLFLPLCKTFLIKKLNWQFQTVVLHQHTHTQIKLTLHSKHMLSLNYFETK